MYKIIIATFIFCIILFLYLHIQFHLKTSDDLEIYEVDQASKDRVEEICDLRQPVLLDILSEDDTYKIIKTTNKQVLLDNYPVFDIKIRNTNDDIFVTLPLHVAFKLFDEDKNSVYFSEGNMDFLQETGSLKNMSYNDEFYRPYLVSNCYYDVLFASSNVETPFRYDLNYRNYFMVTQGSIKIKLAPPKSSKYLYPIKDYENFEFKSPVNPWNPQIKYKADFEKIKCLETVLYPGKIFYIPAFWWYSFKFDENTSVSCMKYRTYMNNIAIIPEIFMYMLQNQNIERKIAKPIDNLNLNKEKEKLDLNSSENKHKNDNETEDIEDSSENKDTTEVFDNKYIPDILIPKNEYLYNTNNISATAS